MSCYSAFSWVFFGESGERPNINSVFFFAGCETGHATPVHLVKEGGFCGSEDKMI